jgi:DNA replication and repair protein RecF
MHIATASIRCFRNLAEMDFEFSPRLNIIRGENGQGKTNLLEALNFIALGRSHRGSRAEEMIPFAGRHLHVQVNVEDDEGGISSFEYGLERNGERRFRIDGQALRRRADLVGLFCSVFFSPDSIGLIRSGPERRRRYLDQGLCTLDPAYLKHWQSHARAMRQKAILLKDMRQGHRALATGRQELQAWNRELAAHGAPIYRARADYCRLLEPLASGLGGGNPLLESPELEGDILGQFDYIRENEIRHGRPLRGPQFDDCEIRLAGHDMRTFGSQGESRTAAIALILAQSEVVFQKRCIRPVLFFDDIFSELDRGRARQLQERSVQQHQVFIATARPEDVAGWRPDGLRVWEIRGGRCEVVA